MLIDKNQATLIVVDVQEKLIPAIFDAQTVVKSIKTLISASVAMELPVVFTEQYPKGIGGTLKSLRAAAPNAPVFDKMHFSCVAGHCLPSEVLAREQVILCGIEAHVCVLQTALELRELGKTVWVVADAIGSRSPRDYQIALTRYQQEGVRLVSREMVLFEGLRVSGTDIFRHMSKTFLVEGETYFSRNPNCSLTSTEIAGKTFAEVLALIDAKTPSPERLELANAEGHYILLENVKGQSGSLKLYNYLLEAYGTIDAEAAKAGLKLYAEHTLDALEFPNKHPNIDRLFAIASGQLTAFAPLDPEH